MKLAKYLAASACPAVLILGADLGGPTPAEAQFSMAPCSPNMALCGYSTLYGGTGISVSPQGVISYTGGGSSVTWPASGGIILSSTTDTPGGLVEANGSCPIGSGGAWVVSPCSVIASGVAADGAYYATSGTTLSNAGAAQVNFGGVTINNNGALSASPVYMTGTLASGGNGTTTFPYIYYNCSGATPVSNFSVSGTIFGINACNGNAGRILQSWSGGGEEFFIDNVGNYNTASGSLHAGTSGIIDWNTAGGVARARMQSPADGVVELTNQAVSNWTRLDLGGTASGFMALGVGASGTASLALVAGDGSVPTYSGCTALTTNGSGIVGCTASDERLKNWEGVVTNPTDILMKISSAKVYSWKDQTAYDSRHHIGLSAQDVCKADPLLCAPREVKTNGKTDTVYNYEDRGLISLLIANAQEQQREIDELCIGLVVLALGGVAAGVAAAYSKNKRNIT